MHQVVRTDVHARGFVLPLAAVAFFGTDECRHRYYLLRKNQIERSANYKMRGYPPRGLSPQGGSRPSGRIPSYSPKSGAASIILKRPLRLGNEGEPGMVKGCCAVSGTVEVTTIARAASTRPGQGADVGAGTGWLYKMLD